MQEAFLLMQKDAETFLDLTKDGLVRAVLFSPSSEEHLLYLRIHHLVSDGYSFRLLFQQITERYQALLSGTAFTKSFGDYVAMVEQEGQYKQSEQAEEDRAYWLANMQGAEAISLSKTRSSQMNEAILHRKLLPGATWDKLQQQANHVCIIASSCGNQRSFHTREQFTVIGF